MDLAAETQYETGGGLEDGGGEFGAEGRAFKAPGGDREDAGGALGGTTGTSIPSHCTTSSQPSSGNLPERNTSALSK